MPTGSSTRWRRPAPAGSATTSGARSPRRAPARSPRCPVPTPRSARSAPREQVAETRIEMVLRPRTGVRPWWPRCGRRTPTRSRRSTCSSWPRCRAAAGSAGSGRWPPAGTLRELRRARGARRCRRPRRGVRVGGDPDRAGAHASRCAAERATTCSTPSGRPAPTPTSPPTCGTTRRPRRSSTARPALVDVQPLGQRVAVAGRLRAAAARRARRAGADTVETRVSRLVTDPWTDAVTAVHEQGVRAESRRLRPAAPARRAGARHPARPARPPPPRPCPSTPRWPSWRPAGACCATSSSAAETEQSDLARELTQGRGRRRPGAGPRRAGPAAAGRRPGLLAQGAGEPAARDRHAGPPPGRPRGRRARDHGAAGVGAEPAAPS